MIRRILAVLFVAVAVSGIVVADDTRGTIVKIEDGSITIRPFGGFGKGKGKGEKVEDKTFKISKDVKVTKAGKDKDDVKTLSIDKLKAAMEVTNIFVTITHDGDVGNEIKIGFGGRGDGAGKRKGKGKEKPKAKDDAE